jgi:hypothetical protein
MAHHKKTQEVLMGIFDKLFGGNKSFPKLDESSPHARYLENMKGPLAKLIEETSDPIEIIPSENRSLVFIGKPPKRFGIAWVGKDGKIVTFKNMIEEKSLSDLRLEKLSNGLRDVYVNHKSEPRYETTICDRQIVVTPSEPLLADVKEVIDKMVNTI